MIPLRLSARTWRGPTAKSFVALALALAFCSPAARAQGRGEVALVNATVVDVEHGRLLPRQTIVIRDGRILRIGPGGTSAARRVDLRGGFVIPGLWDMHVHITPEEQNVQAAASYYGATFLRSGVTGIRDVGGNAHRLAAMDSIGRIAGAFPRLIFSGAKIGPADDERGHFGIADVKSSIATRRANGATFMKLNPAFPTELFRQAFGECAAAGVRCVAHIPPADTSVWLTAPGRGSWEHLFNLSQHVSNLPAGELFAAEREYHAPTLLQRVMYKVRLRKRPMDPASSAVVHRDTTKDHDFFARVASSGGWFTPTLILHHQMTRTVELIPAAYDPQLALSAPPDEERSPEAFVAGQDTWKLLNGVLLAMWRAGTNLLAGTDFSARHVPGGSLQGELVLLQDAGIPAADVLRMATLNPAKYLGAADTLGSVSAGRVADLVVLRRNPLEDIRSVAEIEMVVTRGRLLGREALDSLTGAAIRARAAMIRETASIRP